MHKVIYKIKRFLMVLEKSERLLNQIKFGILVGIIMVSTMAIYLLGQLHIIRSSKQGIRVVQKPKIEHISLQILDSSNVSKPIIVSKNGQKYYFSWCSGVNRIKSENMAYFSDENEAKAAGYELSKTCKK